MIDRRKFLHRSGGIAAAAIVGSDLAGPAVARGGEIEPGSVEGFEIATLPTQVFKRTSDFNRDRVEYFSTIVVLTSTEQRAVEPDRLEVTLLDGATPKVTTSYDRSALAAVNMLPPGPSPSKEAPYRVYAMSLKSTHPQALNARLARCEISFRGASGKAIKVVKEIPIETFVQKTKLLFPFRGVGIITQGGALNDGHRNRSGMFAIDAMALTDLYGVMRKDGDSSDSVAGWGRPIIAPASGTVVTARSDRPDQPVIGVSDPKYYAPEFPDGGDNGNHVIIDHGNGEFSKIAHFQQDTLSVKVGDRVEAGQQLGLLGSSGDSTAPHVHHQLQSGPSWTASDALPHHYENGPVKRHDRGWMFHAE